MRRSRLAPSRPAPAVAVDPPGSSAMLSATVSRTATTPAVPGAAVPSADAPPAGVLDHRALAGPNRARPRHRWLFHPRTGWFRSLERRANKFLSRTVYPWMPGLSQIYGLQLERSLTVVEGEIDIPGLPQAFDGAKLLLVTDIHAGPFLTPALLQRVFERLASLHPDLILLGGDLTTVRLAEFPPYAGTFATLRAPLGVFAVLGNHDHYTGEPARLRGLIESCGIEVLHNRSVVLERDGARLALAGIDDLLCGRPDLEKALAGVERGTSKLLLSHNPDILFEAARAGVALVLSGHTHGGQIRIPGLPVLVRMSRYRLDEGRYATGGTQLVVSRGLGATGLPLRLACPPEAVFLRLHPTAAA